MNVANMDIAVVEGDRHVGQRIAEQIKAAGHGADWFATGREFFAACEHGSWDALLLALTLPDTHGSNIVCELRQAASQMPIIMMSQRATPQSRVRCLDLGADDFLPKPFDVQELLARLRVLERRQTGRQHKLVRHGDIVLDAQSREVRYQRRRVALSRREFDLLATLLQRPGHVFSKAQLEAAIYDAAKDLSSNTIEVHIHRLRKKLYGGLIRTVRGVGYIVENKTQQIATRSVPTGRRPIADRLTSMLDFAAR